MNDEESFKWAFEKSYDEELLWFECIDGEWGYAAALAAERHIMDDLGCGRDKIPLDTEEFVKRYG